jgi:hypothetical protein
MGEDAMREPSLHCGLVPAHAPPRSFVRSVTMDKWSDEQLKKMKVRSHLSTDAGCP